MKRYSHTHHKHRRYDRSRHSVAEWMLLIVSWLVILPIAALCVHLIWLDLQPKAAEACEAPSANETDDSDAGYEDAAAVFAAAEPVSFQAEYRYLRASKALRSAQPTVLIYHTHTTEAYLQTEQNRYQESSRWRTYDNTKNIVAVGEALKKTLERDYGFTVLHDTTDHEPPKLATAYERSLKTMEAYHRKYPSIVLFIDLHRDAYQDTDVPADYVTIDGTETARMMCVIGKGEKYTEKPFFETNYALAERMTSYLQSIHPKLARPIRVKTGRYNQHVSANCILVEVGHNANTLEQALAAMPYLAESIAYAFSTQSSEPLWVPN